MKSGTEARWLIGLTAILVPLVLMMTYGFALLGEPQSLWLMRDILGVIK